MGGLGHPALHFLNKWGCGVTAFTSREAKQVEARRLAALPMVSSRDSDEPATTARTLDFCACYSIAPVVEVFPMGKVNEALDPLRSGEACYRVVLKN